MILKYATVDEDRWQNIVFVASGGAFTGTEAELFALLRLGVELGCEYVDMETTWSDAARSKVYTIHTINRFGFAG
jgi:3-dehydroquinate dehydratase